MPRLDLDKQNKLSPNRMEYAKNKIISMGYNVYYEDNVKLKFIFNNNEVILYPYSGWHTGKSINDGRGISELLNQLKQI